jgi:hypothetical protein
MKSSNNLIPILFKASAFATILFWILIFSEKFESESFIIAILILSIIPILIVCSLTILFTIAPFFLFKKNNISNDEIFKKYIPYYSIIIFGISTYYMISTKFNNIVCAFFITAFFTLIKSWIWICKTSIARINHYKFKN